MAQAAGVSGLSGKLPIASENCARTAGLQVLDSAAGESLDAGKWSAMQASANPLNLAL